MMIQMNEKLERVMNETTDKEKIRLFYELAKHTLQNTADDYDEMDKDMQNLMDDIRNVVEDIKRL